MIKHEYALYKGDTFLDLGTADYLANKFNVKKKTILYYMTNAYKRKMKKTDENRLILIRIEEENERDKC